MPGLRLIPWPKCFLLDGSGKYVHKTTSRIKVDSETTLVVSSIMVVGDGISTDDSWIVLVLETEKTIL